MEAKPINLGFVIADAEDVRLAYDGQRLVASFTDWQEQPCRVTFHETVAFRWQRAEHVGPGEAFDAANVIDGSPWLDDHRRQAEATDEHRHLKLNFNAAGCLEVICTDVRQ
jgi:hypothetical protein